MIDLEADAKAQASLNKVTPAKAKKLGDLVMRAGDLETQMTTLQLQLANLTEEYRTLVDKTIPTLLIDDMGQRGTTTANGVKVEVVDVINANIAAGAPSEQREKGFAYLEANDAGDLVKTDLVISFGRGEDKLLNQFLASLRRRKNPPKFTAKKNVHAQTLGAWVRERISKGLNVDDALLGVFRGRTTKITYPKDETNGTQRKARSR